MRHLIDFGDLSREEWDTLYQRADQIIRRIASDFQIPTTSIANTGHTIKSLVIKNDTTLYDIILKALKQTKSQTGRH